MHFFDMFDEAANQMVVTSGKFVDMLEKFDRLPARSYELKKEEEQMDEIIERIIKALDRTFITPFDREDIHTLATSLDDIMDNMEKTSYRMEVFRIDRPTRRCEPTSLIASLRQNLSREIAMTSPVGTLV